MRILSTRTFTSFLICTLAWISALPSRAMAVLDDPDCSTSADAASCNHLSSFLQILYVVAAILAVLLLIVLVIAVIAWQKNKRTEIDKL